MNNALIQCPKCRAWLVEGVFNQPEFAPCPACGTPLQVEVFPALFRETGTGRSGEAIMVEGESSCFFHPQKKAVVPCAGCGRFLCALCDCEFRGEHYCPACLEAGKDKGKIVALDRQRTRYDNIALSIAVLPMLLVPLIYFTIVTAPMALFIVIRYWKAPRSLVQPGSFRFILAIIVALLQIGGWTALVIGLFSHRT